jgi:hypothetical protein
VSDVLKGSLGPPLPLGPLCQGAPRAMALSAPSRRESTRRFFSDFTHLSMVDRLLHDDLRKIYLKLESSASRSPPGDGSLDLLVALLVALSTSSSLSRPPRRSLDPLVALSTSSSLSRPPRRSLDLLVALSTSSSLSQPPRRSLDPLLALLSLFFSVALCVSISTGQWRSRPSRENL